MSITTSLGGKVVLLTSWPGLIPELVGPIGGYFI